MSDSNRTKITLVKETVFGAIPATPAFEELRTTGASMSASIRTDVSKELVSDGQVKDLILLGKEAGGNANFELSYGSLLTVMEGALRSTWANRFLLRRNVTAGSAITSITAAGGTVTFSPAGTAPVAGDVFRLSGFTNAANNGIFVATGGSTTTALFASLGLVDEPAPPMGAQLTKVGVQFGAAVISAGAAPNTLVRSAGSWITDGIVPGEWIKVGGAAAATQFATAAMASSWVRVATVTALTLTLDRVPTGWAVDAGTGKTIKLFYGDYIRNGVALASYTLEEQFQDLTAPEFFYYNGLRVGTLTIEATASAIATAQVTFMGTGTSIALARTAGATDIPPRDTDVLNSSSNVGRLAENDAVIQGPNYVMGMGIEINNNLRRQNQVGSVTSWGIGVGRCIVTGKLNTYYGSKAILDKLINSTTSSYDVRFLESDGSRGLLFDCPKIKFMGNGEATVPGVDTDRMLDLGFQALKHTALGYTIEVMRFEGLE